MSLVKAVIYPGRPSGLETDEDAAFTVLWDRRVTPGLSAVEFVIGYDRALAEPADWLCDGGLYVMRLESGPASGQQHGLVRVMSIVHDHAETEDPVVPAGTIAFALTSPGVYFRPELLAARGVVPGGGVVDLRAGFEGDLPGDTQVVHSSVLKPSLRVASNPCRGPLQLQFGAPAHEGEHLRVDMYDVRGRCVARIYDGANDGQMRSAEIGSRGDWQKLPAPGVYFLRLYVDGRTRADQKVVLVR